MVWEDLAAGRLEAVMQDWSLPEIALNLVSPPGTLRPARVAVLIEYLTGTLSAAPWGKCTREGASLNDDQPSIVRTASIFSSLHGRSREKSCYLLEAGRFLTASIKRGPGAGLAEVNLQPRSGRGATRGFGQEPAWSMG